MEWWAMENPEDMINRDPLLKFSLYTAVQKSALSNIGQEIVAHLDNSNLPDGHVSPAILRAYELFWLWTLGAYEVIRVMDEHTGCFAPSVAKQIKALKKRLATIRMPFAKQLHTGKAKRPIYAELSISGVGAERNDMIFVIGDQQYSTTALIKEVRDFLGGIKPVDIKGALPLGPR
jgi:hypothetical protein